VSINIATSPINLDGSCTQWVAFVRRIRFASRWCDLVLFCSCASLFLFLDLDVCFWFSVLFMVYVPVPAVVLCVMCHY
jgi:hypothetical protein